MASVIRIKRRRTDDPAEALLLSQIKKSRTTAESEAGGDPNVESVLEFAGTLNSKDESVSKQIKDAMRRKKLHKQMHPHSSDFQLPYHRAEMADRLRKQKTEASHNKRYQITCSRRALDIDSLDSGQDLSESHDDKEDELKKRLSGFEENKEKSSKTVSQGSCGDGVDNQMSSSVKGDGEESISNTVSSKQESCGASGKLEGKKEDKKIFFLLDVEHEKLPDRTDTIVAQPPCSTDEIAVITVNGAPMKKSLKPSSSTVTADNKVPVMEESDDYVYDLYYTHTRLGHVQDPSVLTVQILSHDFLYDERDDEGDDFVYDDEDDSNDEGNWRNDYPDEDPRFFENADQDYDFQNNMRESNFAGGADDDDEGDLLSYWMNTRCRLDVDCNEFGDDDYGRGRSSSDEEAGAELGYY